jgi:hypothetical protein
MDDTDTASAVPAHPPPAGAARSFDDVEPRLSVDTALRTSQQNVVAMSGIADGKANIMITVCSLVLSISLTQLQDEVLRWPLGTLGLFSAAALVLAMYAALPSLGAPPRDRLAFNPFFFGHLPYVTRAEYSDRMVEILESDAVMYEAMVSDLYNHSVGLARKKYRALRYAYLVFIAGVVVTVAVGLVVLVA